jgi:hypothetical protein
MLASQPPLERNSSEWLVGSPTFQALNVYNLQDLAERFSARGFQREVKTCAERKGRPNWRLKLRNAEKCLMSFWSRANVHMTAIMPIKIS